jgi:hypothetical protein
VGVATRKNKMKLKVFAVKLILVTLMPLKKMAGVNASMISTKL